jgi:hypothetical protein
MNLVCSSLEQIVEKREDMIVERILGLLGGVNVES